MANMLTVVVGVCLLVGVAAQGPQIGFCNTYQTTQAFNQAFISKMQENEEGYSFLLTSGPTYGCQKLTFLPNGTFSYNFIDVANGLSNTTGSYQMKPFSFTTPASITLSSLPFGELGSILGTTSFNVLLAEEDLLVLLSCVNIGLIRTQQVHVLIPESSSASVAASEVNTTVQELQVPLAEHLVEVQQTCDTTTQGDGALHLLNRLYTRLGYLYPSVPVSGYGGAMYPGFQLAVGNSNMRTALGAGLPQQVQAQFLGYGAQPLANAQSSVYPQPTTQFNNVAPQLFGPQVVPRAPAGAQFGVQQHSNPTNVFSEVPSDAGSFGSLPRFAAQAPFGVTGLVSQAQPFQQPTQSAQAGSLQSGTYSVIY